MTDATPRPRRAGPSDSDAVWSEEERAAVRAYTRERKRTARRDPAAERAEGEQDVLAKIATLAEPDRAIAERLHAIVASVAPELVPRTWYGSPAYAKDGNVVCFFQERAKFRTRYATLGFSDKAHLDDGSMWANSYAVSELTPAVDARIAELVKKAVR